MNADETVEASDDDESLDAGTFARLIFYGVTLLGRPEKEVWLMPLGHLLDQWEIYKQFNGISKTPERPKTIDEIFSDDLF